MSLFRLALVAALIGSCNGVYSKSLSHDILRRDRTQNSSAVTPNGNLSNSPSYRYSLFNTRHIWPTVQSTPTGYVSDYSSTAVHLPAGTGSTKHPISNETCAGQPTLNVLGASLDWWYSSTIYNVVSTFSIEFNANDSATGWTLLPATTSFDLNSALGSSAPVAAETTILTQTAYRSPNATTEKGQIPNIIATPPLASLTVPLHITSFREGTPFVHFSSYEIITKVPSNGYGSAGCATVTKTSTLPSPFAFPYSGQQANGITAAGAGVTGDVNPAFLDIVDASAVAGSWVAAPTVAIVVQEVFGAEAALAASTERTEKSLMTPTPTLPSFLSPVHRKTTDDKASHGSPNSHTETTATFLLVPDPTPIATEGEGNGGSSNPGGIDGATQGEHRMTIKLFVAHLETTAITLDIAVKPSRTAFTATIRGTTIVAQRMSQGHHPAQAAGTGMRGFVTAIADALHEIAPDGSHGEPTNAVQVLSEAAASLDHDRPGLTASRGAGNGKSSNGVPARQTHPVTILGHSTFTADSQTQFRVGKSKTLTPGGKAVVSGTTLSLLPGGSSVVINGHTEAVSRAVCYAKITSAPVLSVGGTVYHAKGGSAYVIGGQTLTPGGVISVDGTFVSLGPGLSTIVINGATMDSGHYYNSAAVTTKPPILTIGGETFKPLRNGIKYIINGETLTPGEKERVTLHAGTIYIVSLAKDATILRIETVGANGKVTQTIYETLYPNAKGELVALTRTVKDMDSVADTSRSAEATGPVPNLQNDASSHAVQLAIVLTALATFSLTMWL